MERVGFGRSVFGFDVRRNGEADLFGDRRLVKAVDCFVGEPFAGSNAGKLEACSGQQTLKNLNHLGWQESH